MFQGFTNRATFETPEVNSRYETDTQRFQDAISLERAAMPQHTGTQGQEGVNYDYMEYNIGSDVQHSANMAQVLSNNLLPYPVEELTISNSTDRRSSLSSLQPQQVPKQQRDTNRGDSSNDSSNNHNYNYNNSNDNSNDNNDNHNLAEYSPIALKFHKIHRQIIQDGQNFTPSLQMKWCKILFLATQDTSFISRYSINAERLQRTLTDNEMKQNKNIILEHAFKVMEKLLRIEYPTAYYFMGCLYSHHVPGLNIHDFGFIDRSDAKALDFYCKGAKLGHSDSAYRAGICFEFGKGISERSLTKEQSLEKALQYYELGALRYENVDCMFKLGIFYLYEIVKGVCDVSAGIEWLLKAVEFGDSNQACYELGKLHEFDGLNEETQRRLVEVFGDSFRDNARALHYYYKCAMEFNYPLAQWRLGHAYEFGELGLPVMASKSIAWYLKSSIEEENNSSPPSSSTITIGDIDLDSDTDSESDYDNDNDNDNDNDYDYEYDNDNNNTNINNNDDEDSNDGFYDPELRSIKKKKKSRQEERRRIRRRRKRRKQKRNPNPMAMLSLAGWFFTGAPNVLSSNYAESFYWVEKSCQVSDGKLARSEYVLGYYYANGIGCDVNMDRALLHYQRAAKLGHRKAIETLHNFYNGFVR